MQPKFTLRHLAALPVLAALQTASVAAPQGPIQTNPTPPDFYPWIYEDIDPSNPGDGRHLIWGRHQYYEDNRDTVFVLAREMVTVPGQIGVYPEVILLNYASFDPPDGVDAAAGTRRLNLGVESGGIYTGHQNQYPPLGMQVCVNVSDAPRPGGRYQPPTFFVDHDFNGEQFSVPQLGFDPLGNLSATRGAFGTDTFTPKGGSPETWEFLYVTASVGYALTDFATSDHAVVQEARQDRLWFRVVGSGNRWFSIAIDVGSGQALEGNSSGVGFGHLNGDAFIEAQFLW